MFPLWRVFVSFCPFYYSVVAFKLLICSRYLSFIGYMLANIFSNSVAFVIILWCLLMNRSWFLIFLVNFTISSEQFCEFGQMPVSCNHPIVKIQISSTLPDSLFLPLDSQPLSHCQPLAPNDLFFCPYTFAFSQMLYKWVQRVWLSSLSIMHLRFINVMFIDSHSFFIAE